MKKPTILFLFSLLLTLISNSQACDIDNMIFKRETEFNLFSSKKEDWKVNSSFNLPIYIDGEPGCLKTQGGINFKVKDNERKLNIYFPEAESEGIDDFELNHYLYVEKDTTDIFNIEIASFSCSGEIVLTSENFAGTIGNARQIQHLYVNANPVFAFGAAAKLIADSKRSNLEENGIGPNIPNNLYKYFLNHSNIEEVKQLEHKHHSIPFFYAGFQINSTISHVNSIHTSINSTKIGCSSEFKKVMEPFRIENHKIGNGPIYKIEKNKVKLRW